MIEIIRKILSNIFKGRGTSTNIDNDGSVVVIRTPRDGDPPNINIHIEQYQNRTIEGDNNTIN